MDRTPRPPRFVVPIDSPKELAAAAVAAARAELDEALGLLERIPSFDPDVLGFETHALNNYLTVTASCAELLQHALTDHPDELVRYWVENVRHATELMTHTVARMAAADAAGPRVRFRRAPLPRMAYRATGYYQRAAARKNITLVCGTAVDVPPVWTDPVLVGAVLDNLISNAVKYTPPGKRVWVNVYGEPGAAVCVVKDEGPGLSPEDQARLFERGAKLAPRPTAGEPSHGFGLAVAKELVATLGGAIWCDTKLGAGCSFGFRIPAYDPAAHGPVTVSGEVRLPPPG